MKKIIGLIAVICSFGCTAEHLYEPQSSLTVTGNTYYGFQEEHSRSLSLQMLPEESRISLFATGGIEAHNAILTFRQGRWQHTLEWKHTPEPVHLSSYYPVFPENQNGFYESDGLLKDFLYCRQQVAYKENIALEFKHLFSLLTIEVKEGLKSNLRQLAITPSQQISSIDPYSGKMEFATGEPRTYVLEGNKEGSYSFLIPPAPQMSIRIRLTYSDNQTKEADLSPRDYQQNRQYICRLTPSEKEPGIYTGEDLVAFTHLINGNPYKDRRLEEFGHSQGSRTVYTLQNDIRLTPAESKQIQPIGYVPVKGDKKGLKDCFDGKGNTIYGLSLYPFHDSNYLGLFSYISPEGEVKNLTLSHAEIAPSTWRYRNIGLLCGLNGGTINNCRITDSRIKPQYQLYLGAIACYNKGIILNCSVENTSFYNINPNGNTGGIVSETDGSVLNSYIAHCDLKNILIGAGICHRVTSGGVIQNCYSHQNTHKPKVAEYAHIVYETSGYISNCYYMKESSFTRPVYKKSRSSKNFNTYPYEAESFLIIRNDNSRQPVVNALNNWIQTTGKKQYPKRQFHEWRSRQELPAYLQRTVR